MTDALPKWLKKADLDVDTFYMPVVPHGQGDALRAAAKAHLDALLPCGPEEATRLLERLRFVTKLNNESEFEKRIVMESLIRSLKDIPRDILADGLAAYVNAPGERWFPKSAGEVRAFTDKPLARRRARVARLNEMAKVSDATADPQAVRSSWDQPIPLDQVEEENLLFKSVGSKMRYSPETGIIFQLKPGDIDPCQPASDEHVAE